MVTKKKITKHFLQKYWGDSCTVCGTTTPPIITFAREELSQAITATCPECGLTITFRDHIFSFHSPKNHSKNLRDCVITL
ncbi:MAG: hypothetical protein U9O98_10905 [Asgard group archaeon]|nr:hypothetical protein [Asgard group archaeon]